MEPYSEKELIEFANECIGKRNITDGVNDAELQNWKETLLQRRRNEKLNKLGI